MIDASLNAGAVKMRSREANRQMKKRIPRTAASLLKCLTRWPPLAWAPYPYPPRSPHNISRCASICVSVQPCVCLSVCCLFVVCLYTVCLCLSVRQPPHSLIHTKLGPTCSAAQASVCIILQSGPWSELRNHPAPKLLMFRPPQSPKSVIIWLANSFLLFAKL